MSDNFNINLDQAAQGAKDVMGLGPAVAANATSQANQEQLVNQAIERTKQARMETGLQENGGLAAEKGLVPKAQVLSEMKSILATRDDLDDDQKAQILQDAEDTMPDTMNGYDVARFTTALREAKQPSGSWGTAFPGGQAPKGATDVAGNAINPNSYYQESDAGELRQAGEPNAVLSAAGKAEGADKQGILKLNTAIDSLLKTRFGSTGMLATTIFRATRAINTLQSNPNLTAQDLDNVATDIAAIYQGGVPGAAQSAANSYRLTFLDFADTFRKFTGRTLNPSSWFNSDNQKSPVVTQTENKMLQTLNDMRTSSEQSLQAALDSESAAFKLAKAADPAEINQLIESKMRFIESGVLVPDSAHTALRIGDKYTVSGSPSIPASPETSTEIGAPPTVAANTNGGQNNDPLGIR